MAAKYYKPSRRQEKIGRVVLQAVSTAIRSLADPRIEGIVTVTHVEMSSDLRHADVYLSIMADRSSVQRRTYSAIEHAIGPIQAHVAEAVRSKFCPVIRFHQDEQFKKTLEIMNLIDLAASEYRDRDSNEVVPADPGDADDPREG